MGEIACICGKAGRVQHQRMKFLKENYLQYIDVYTDPPKELSSYNIVYFTHYSLAKKVKFKNVKLASVTSHKYNKGELKKFDGISVNNEILMYELRKFKPDLTECGVDTNFWNYESESYPTPRHFRLGWVGNKDRKAKNYKLMEKIMKKYKSSKWFEYDIIATSKHDNANKLKTPKEMREYYRRLTHLFVTSTSEGTPNPALEAAACGVKIVGTPVGCLGKLKTLGNAEFHDPEMFILSMGHSETNKSSIRHDVMQFDWSNKWKQWDNFFRRYM